MGIAHHDPSATETELRRELAAVYRLVAHYRMADLVFTHISVRLPGEDDHFLINPYGLFFEEIDYPDMVALEGYSIEDDVLEITSGGIELKNLLVRLIGKYGITFPEGDLKRRIKGMETEDRLTIHRDPPVTPKTGRRTTSMNYRDHRIWVERKTNG